MHYSVYVALPGQLPDDESVLQYELERALDPFNPEGKSPEWDWWLIGGRWGGAWVLREGAANGPLATEPGVFGATEHDDGRIRTDCARWRDLEPESVTPPYSYVCLCGHWNTRWRGPDHPLASRKEVDSWQMPEAEWGIKFLSWLQNCPEDTWLIAVDCHN